MKAPPPRLLALQRAFGRALQTPPRVHAHGFDPAGLPTDLARALAPPAPGTPSLEARLSLYRSQHWQRLFRALQDTFPRATRVAGPFAFNQLALAWLTATPPRAHDLGATADGFVAALLAALRAPTPVWPDGTGVPPALQPPLAEAARLDEAARLAWLAPWRGVWQPTPDALQDILGRRLRVAPGLTVVRLTHDLLHPDAIPDRAPVPLDGPLHLVVARTADGTALRPVPPTLARLLHLSRNHTLGDALAALEAACEPALHAALPAHLPDHLQQALTQGWWVGIAESA